MYGDIQIDPIEIVRFQRDIGSDIGTILDVFGTPDQTKKEATEGVDITIARAKKSVSEKGTMLLACPVQGSIYPDLRERCARELSALDADFFPIGGVVPLMENQYYADLVRSILAAKRGLDCSKPVHLFGAGHPMMFSLAVAIGCDFFDSSAYAKYAQDDRMCFSWGTKKLDDLSELPCCCPICSSMTAKELKDMEKNERIRYLAMHNLYMSFSEMKTIRAAMKGGWLWELVEQRAATNPALSDALRELHLPEHLQWLEQYEPVSKKNALWYTGPHTIHRPLLHRYHTRLFTRYKPVYNRVVVFPEGTKPYSIFYAKQLQELTGKIAADCIVDASFGPVPFELDEMYPLAQSMVPIYLDEETKIKSKALMKKFLSKKIVYYWDALKKPSGPHKKIKSIDPDVRRIDVVADMQFGTGASDALFSGEVQILKSRRTGKIRTASSNGKHVVSMRAEDGLFTLKIQGAQRLHQSFRFPLLRVVVMADAVPFIKEGKSVFAKFVTECDPELRPFDECLIVDEHDTLIAVGQTFLTRSEMMAFDYGVAAYTRESISNKNQ